MTDVADTRQRIIDATVKVIDEQGEPAVRVAKVAKDAGVTQGMVTYHFETRDHLVAEAHAQRFGATMNLDNEVALAAIERVETLDDLMQIVREMSRVVLTPARAEARRVRASAVGYAIASEELAASIRTKHTQLLDSFASVFEVARHKGLLKPGLEPRAVATMASAYTFGLILADFDEQAPDESQLLDVIVAFLSGVLAT